MASPRSESETTAAPKRLTRRTYVACRRCHAQKIKCNGEIPCRGCRRSNCANACVFPVRDKKITISDSYLRTLQAENEELKRKQSITATSPLLPGPTADLESPAEPIPESDGDEDVTADVADPLLEQHLVSVSNDQSTSRPVYIGGSACTAFATRLRSHVTGNKAVVGSPCVIRVYKHQRLQRMLDTEFQLPSRPYGTMLAQVMLRFVGSDYHLIQRKSFFQRLEQLYSDQFEVDPIFVCRVFIVLALGELYLRKTSVSENGHRVIPGTGFFLQASSLFQELYEEPNVEYIETLLLMSYYSHALNRKNTAYTYSGLALRLSITLGLHRNITYGPNIKPVDVENRRRVWWTVYTFDRICSSKLGHPVMIKDDDIDAPLPSSGELSPEEAEEFVDAEHLIANIKLARITGSILDLIYGIPSKRDVFVRNVHRILTALKEWDATLSSKLKLDKEKVPPYSSRPVASLRLHFNQCIILTTRPVLLSVFKHHVKRTGGELEASPGKQLSPMTIAMSEACIYAARASNRLLGQLWADGSIATFGFFDAHYIFSSTVVLMMSNTLSPNSLDKDSVELAWNLIRSMVDDGNLPAREFWERLVSLQKDLDELDRSNNTQTLRPTRGYVSAAGTFAAHVNPIPREPAYSPESREKHIPRPTTVQHAAPAITPSSPHDVLEDPFILEFLDRPDSQWSPGMFDVSTDETGTWSLAWDTGNILHNIGDL